ncbi:hypothetical protein M9Y10_034976 [Tritrichomonas musculus]|uniref:Viral A-type inclusion protein n=1 Tax=Tritrichomonas musculus TaxID=1915356 RepID=A0ABR2KH88_9EUKA
MQTDTKSSLIQAYYKAEKNVAALKVAITQSEKELREISAKIKLADETKLLSDRAKEKQPELEKKVDELERLAAKCETLAARENSRQNSTPEVRMVNQKIEIALEEVHKQEGHASQAQMDCSALEHEKEKLEQEFQEQNEQSQKKLSLVYSSIQQYRQEISQNRFKNLTAFLTKQDKFTSAEIELQKLQTMTMLYTQLNAGIEAELAALHDGSENGVNALNSELEKVEQLIQSIPNHTLIKQEQQDTLKTQCDKQINDIKELEQRIISSIDEMSQAEGQQDSLTKQLHEEQTKNDELRTFLQSEEILINESEDQIKNLQEKDANKLDLAKLEIEKLTEKTNKLRQTNQEKEQQIEKLREGNTTISGDAKHLKSLLDVLRNQIQNESKEMSAEIDRLKQERDKLKNGTGQVVLQ